MNIEFAEESETELTDRKGLYLLASSELSQKLLLIQEAIENNGFELELPDYVSINDQWCKFYMELIDEPDVSFLQRRANTVKKISLNITKLKWDFIENTFVLKIGKVQSKELHIVIANLSETPSETTKQKIKEIKNQVLGIETPSPAAPPQQQQLREPNRLVFTPKPTNILSQHTIEKRKKPLNNTVIVNNMGQSNQANNNTYRVQSSYQNFQVPIQNTQKVQPVQVQPAQKKVQQPLQANQEIRETSRVSGMFKIRE